MRNNIHHVMHIPIGKRFSGSYFFKRHLDENNIISYTISSRAEEPPFTTFSEKKDGVWIDDENPQNHNFLREATARIDELIKRGSNSLVFVVSIFKLRRTQDINLPRL